jgi:uncharacterized protein YndB with AHSA1/START domain
VTTTSTREAEIHIDPDVPLVRITREFDFPAEKVFRAHAEPDLFVRWNGPRGLEMHVDRFAFETGGDYRYRHADENGEYAFVASGMEVGIQEGYQKLDELLAEQP